MSADYVCNSLRSHCVCVCCCWLGFGFFLFRHRYHHLCSVTLSRFSKFKTFWPVLFVWRNAASIIVRSIPAGNDVCIYATIASAEKTN